MTGRFGTIWKTFPCRATLTVLASLGVRSVCCSAPAAIELRGKSAVMRRPPPSRLKVGRVVEKAAARDQFLGCLTMPTWALRSGPSCRPDLRAVAAASAAPTRHSCCLQTSSSALKAALRRGTRKHGPSARHMSPCGRIANRKSKSDFT